MILAVPNRVVATLLLVCLLGACKKEQSAAPAQKTTSEKPLPRSSAPATKPSSVPKLLPKGFRLAILAGQGVGPIRIGATVPTVERLMMGPCEERTETLCRYVSQGIEFELRSGETVAIQIHRPGRRVQGPGKHAAETYGLINAVIPPDVAVGMLPDAVQKVLGKPESIEKVTDAGVFETVERHSYEGLVLEYDRNALNNNVILGGIRVVKPATAGARGSAGKPAEKR